MNCAPRDFSTIWRRAFTAPSFSCASSIGRSRQGLAMRLSLNRAARRIVSKTHDASARLFTSPDSQGKMPQIAGKIRYVLRGLGILAGGLLIIAAAFAVVLPFVIDAEAIRGP